MKSYKQRINNLISKTLTNIESYSERGNDIRKQLDSLNELINIKNKLKNK